MAQLRISRAEMDNADRVHAAVANAVQNFDFDSGWVALTTNRVVKHKLGILPKTLRVYVSDSKAGEGFDNEGFTNCTSTQVTVGGAKAYARVLANK